MIRACGRKRFVDWAFGHYLRIAAAARPLASGAQGEARSDLCGTAAGGGA